VGLSCNITGILFSILRTLKVVVTVVVTVATVVVTVAVMGAATAGAATAVMVEHLLYPHYCHLNR